MKHRTPTQNSKYYIPKEEYLTAIHYSLRYPLLQEEYKFGADTSKAITYDKEKVQTSNDFCSTEEIAIRLAEIKQKIDLIDDTLIEAAGEVLAPYIKFSVCFGMTYVQLQTTKDMPCGQRHFYELRRKYYYLLSKKI